jgi:transcriptional regulator with PAS, ATPase and Fis domain
MISLTQPGQFMLLLPETNSRQAAVLAERLTRSFAHQPFTLPGGQIAYACTIGIASFPEDGAEPQELKSRARMALEEALKANRKKLPFSELSTASADEGWAMREVFSTPSAAAEPSTFSYPGITAYSPGMQKVLRILRRIARSNHPVIIQGESGTGKELLAQAIHAHSERHQGAFVALSCASLAETLLEAELFGYVKGAFTGALEDRKGYFEIAHGGTLFLDEIGEMSLNMQKKLLRVLEEKKVRPLGQKAEERPVDVRIICATNRNLQQLVESQHFRQDLFYRLNVITIHIPPLRERREDIIPLAQSFIETDESGPTKRLSVQAKQVLLDYHWPGNVRELENVIKNVCALYQEPVITAEAIRRVLDIRPAAETVAVRLTDVSSYQQLRQRLLAVEREYVLRTLRSVGGNRQRAAAALGISRPALYRLLKKLGIASGHSEEEGS